MSWTQKSSKERTTESANRAGPVHYRTAAVGGVNVCSRYCSRFALSGAGAAAAFRSAGGGVLMV